MTTKPTAQQRAIAQQLGIEPERLAFSVALNSAKAAGLLSISTSELAERRAKFDANEKTSSTDVDDLLQALAVQVERLQAHSNRDLDFEAGVKNLVQQAQRLLGLVARG
ncbi:MAG: hypothetical protein ACLQDV_02940 [Candidatus Binataceae bacterium]